MNVLVNDWMKQKKHEAKETKKLTKKTIKKMYYNIMNSINV